MVIHSNDEDVIMKFALEKPAFRILVNTVASVGAVGYTTALSPSMTLGPGTLGGSIISDNVTAKHLMNIKSLAFETNPINKGQTISSFKGNHSSTTYTPQGSFIQEIEERLKARAGNLPLKESYHTNKEYVSVNKPSTINKPKTYGSGISEEEIQKIIRKFKRG